MNLRALTLALCVFMLSAPVAHATTMMSFVSDLISTSAPGASATHRLQFTVAHAVPASGQIVIRPENGAFTIPPSFDYTDIDFAVWNGAAYIDRSLASAPSATEDGVTILSGASGSITINLSPSAGLAAGDQIQILLGTNATFGATGDVALTNPAVVTSYRIIIDSNDTGGNRIDYGSAMIAIVYPVTIFLPLENNPPAPIDGLPSGEIAANNPTIEITFSTDRTATCRYSMASSTPYDSMTESFSSANGIFFYIVLGGHANATSYTYYVKCRGVQGAISEDYPISFSLAATPISNTSVTQGGGSSGSGDFVGGSQTLYQSTVTLSGFTAPASTLIVLKDGKQALSTQAGSGGVFQAVVPSLERGTYTFSVYSLDSKGRKSATYSSVLAIAQATNNIISGIVLPPTVGLENDSIAIGEKANILGFAAPGAMIDILFAQQGSTNIKQYSASSTQTGAWNITTDSLSGGNYSIRGRTSIPAAQSDYGTPIFLGVGQSALPNLSNKADINKDGKVNLVDFSIMLSFWNTANESADINSDGIVNLADFSILLFNWTG